MKNFIKKWKKKIRLFSIISQKANKQEIKKAFKDAFGVLTQGVNTMNTILVRKKAFIKFTQTNETSEIASW